MEETMMMMVKMLDACEDVENAAAEIYHLYADHFVRDARVARTWRKTALEEENHARQVNLAKKMTKSIALVSIDAWRQVFTVRKNFNAMLDQVRKSPPTLEEALLSSIAMEEKMDHLHMMNAIMMVEKSGNDLFVAMMKEDQGHLLMLKNLLTDMITGSDRIKSDGCAELVVC